jgi:hypothetical protein
MKADPMPEPGSVVPNESGVVDVSSETELPDFAYIEERDGVRVLVNERDGYEISLEDNWVPEYYTNVVEVFVADDYPSDELKGSFTILKNTLQGRSEEEYLISWEERKRKQCDGNCYEKIESIVTDVDRFKDNWALGEHYIDIVFQNENIFEISTSNISIETTKKLISIFHK